MAGDNVYVGTMATGSDEVEEGLKGKRVYYSPRHGKFAIVLGGGRGSRFFGFDSYRRLADGGLLALDEGNAAYIEAEYGMWASEREAERAEAERAEAEAELAAAAGDGDEPDEGDGLLHPGATPDAAYAEPPAGTRDPTRHLRGFFVTCLVLAAMAIAGRLVILPLALRLLSQS